MFLLLQRVNSASLFLRGDIQPSGRIGKGMVVFIGIEKEDQELLLGRAVKKVVELRIFEDEEGKLNFSIKEKNFEIMCIPNFTLCASIEKGRRPSFERAASPKKAERFFNIFVEEIKREGIRCIPGIFGASMVIEVENAGPVNIILKF